MWMHGMNYEERVFLEPNSELEQKCHLSSDHLHTVCWVEHFVLDDKSYLSYRDNNIFCQNYFMEDLILMKTSYFILECINVFRTHYSDIVAAH